ncbi:hypothetical protein ACTXGW_03565 [Psychrobacter faecalis]|uniref:hypothetical protein n=1 Tax=Psychrobacter faecalis TaxID=180588 RepID=UPI003FD0E484
MTDNQIIEKLGGVNAIAKFLGYKYAAVYHWKSRGIAASVKVRFPQHFMPASLDDIKPLTEANKPTEI